MSKYERERESGGFSAAPTTYKAENWISTPALVESSNELADAVGTHEYMWDLVTKRFAQRSARGDVIVSPMRQTREERTMSTPGQLVIDRFSDSSKTTKASTYTYTGPTFLNTTNNGKGFGRTSPLAVSIDVEQLITLAGTAAQADINSPEFEGLVFLAELRETLQFMRSPLRAYQRYLKKQQRRARHRAASKRGLPQNVHTLADWMSSGWLSYRYGLMPIVYDVQDVVSALTSTSHLFDRHTARGYATNLDSETDVQNDTTMFIGQKTVETERKVEVRAGVLYETDVSDTFGMHMQNVPGAAWEIVPFSFVADWFVNVGDFIEAITPKAGTRVLGSWTVTEDTYTTTATAEVTGMSPGYAATYDLVSSHSLDEEIISKSKTRTVGHKIGIESRPLPYSGDLGKKRILDSLSLTYQLLASRISK